MAGKKVDRFKDLLKSIGIVFLISVISIFFYDIYMNIEVKDYSKNEEIKVSKLSAETTINNSDNILTSIEKVSNTIVGISKLQDKGISIFSKESTSQLGLGTGVIVSEDGYILSNEHVSGGKLSTCYVTLEDGREYPGTVVWADANVDLSIIKINVNGLEYSELGNSEDIKVGQRVYAIGNPIGFEFQRSVTSGIISAKDRALKIEEDVYMSGLIQTDATINPGNSGGPLILENGEIVGINSVKIDTAEGIGFAIPINVIKPVIEKLKQEGSFEEATIGVFAYDKEVIPYLDYNLKFENGIYVAQIKENGPAEEAELQIGDIITKIDDVEINKMDKLREYIYQKNPGDKVVLKILRNRREIEVEVVLGKKI